MSNEIKPSGRGLSENEVRLAETRLGIRLPDDYRALVMLHNGGEPIRGHGSVVQGEERLWAQNLKLYSLIDPGDAQGACILEHLHHEFQPYLPKHSLTIGSFDGDIEVVLFVSGARTGQVWLKSMNQHRRDAPESGMYYGAQSFTEFLENLQAEDPGDDVNWIP